MDRMEIDEDFLSYSMEIIRHSIKGIESSYSNFWDILAELIQNSVDAIRKRNVEGKMKVTVDCPQKTIIVRDNGCGIDPDDVKGLLLPFSTNKTGDPKSIGEKGVGLKFAYFQSLNFEMKTGNDKGCTFANIQDARLWKESIDQKKLALKTQTIDEEFYGTEIKLEKIENEILFSLSLEQLIYVLRTKTAAGDVDRIWNIEKKDIDISLVFIDKQGNEFVESVPNRYLLPTEVFDKKTILDVDEYGKWLLEKDRADIDKRNKLKDKILVKKKIDESRNGRIIRLWSCFVPKREVWGKISLKLDLLTNSQYENDYLDSEWKRENNDLLVNPGIYTAVKGMPTTISVDPPTTGRSGYWANMFFIIEDDGLNFDIGRKFIHGKITAMYKNLVADVFRDVTNRVAKYLSGNAEIYEPFDMQSVLLEIGGMSDLNKKSGVDISFEKNPSEQEASVAAIFYEMIGKGIIDDVVPIISGYRNRYDLYAKFNGKVKVIEFKTKLRNILRDFAEIRKIFDELNYIVCWGVTDEDEQAFYREGIEIIRLSTVETDLSLPNNSYISCSTHLIQIQNVSPVYVIDLKEIVCN